MLNLGIYFLNLGILPEFFGISLRVPFMGIVKESFLYPVETRGPVMVPWPVSTGGSIRSPLGLLPSILFYLSHFPAFLLTTHYVYRLSLLTGMLHKSLCQLILLYNCLVLLYYICENFS